MTELTTQEYWENYYKSASEDRAIISKICGKYDSYWKLLIDSCTGEPRSILEVGAFPGRYLAYLASTYKLAPTGIDFNPDEEKFSRSMRTMGVTSFRYICSDFKKHEPDGLHDLVFSNGFIEHFTDYDAVLDRHVRYLRPGGSLLIMIPNKRYLRRVYGNLVDRENQLVHNLECMKLEVFRAFADRNGLKVVSLGYFGGFPFKVHARLSFWKKLIYHPVRWMSGLLSGYLSSNPSKWWSGTIIAVFHRPTT